MPKSAGISVRPFETVRSPDVFVGLCKSLHLARCPRKYELSITKGASVKISIASPLPPSPVELRRTSRALAVSVRAALHFDISVSNFGIQEYMRHTRETDDVFPHAYYFKDGYLHPGEAAGLGVDYDETLAGKFPYQRAYLPVNRKLDGTIFNW